MKKVLCIAECCCDLVFAGLPRIPVLGEEVYGSEFVIKAGGGANTAISLARLNVQTSMVTRIGDDDMGNVVLSALERAGVLVSGKIRRQGSRTEVSAVLSTAEDRCFASYAGAADTRFDYADLDSAISQCDIVHTFLGYCLHYPIAELCEKYGKKLSLDTSWADTQDRARAEEVLRRTDYLKLNEGEAMRLTDCDNPDDALLALSAMCRGSVAITLGRDGCVGKEKNGPPVRQGAVPAGQFRDACGAGDNFAAGFLCGVSNGFSFEKCLLLGSAVAGESVTWLGGNSEELNCTKILPVFRS